MKRVLTAVVLIPVVLAIVFWAPLWLFALVVAAIIILALHEYLAIVEAAGIKPFRWLVYVVSVFPIFLLLLSIVMAHLPPHSRYYWAVSVYRTWWQIALLSPAIFGIPLIFRNDMGRGLGSVAASILGIVYIGVSLSLLIPLRADDTRSVLVIFILFSVWAGDIAAYYVGRSLGRHKLAPVVSPNKSWEGAIASVLASVGIAVLVLHFRHVLDEWFSYPGMFREDTFPPVWPLSLAHALVLGVLTNVAAQFGDLFESALKRGANVKDSGTLLPGHGGMLDRIDALLFAIPIVAVYTSLV
ncbi:MAG TPA: phosphatidate cytidylyltransferase [Candidatus Angelobacter sp.]|nr:phosphatidate cytidylyltransferase [Candidatus Angelobacter sp.]